MAGGSPFVQHLFDFPHINPFLSSALDGLHPNVSDDVQKESLVLHFIDQLCAYHDKPQSIETVKRWFENQTINEVEVFKGGNGVIGRGYLR